MKSSIKNKQGRKLYYPRLVQNGVITTSQLAEQIAGRSSLTRGDVRNVIDNLADVLTFQLREGLAVQLEGLGTFRMGLTKVSSVENKEDVRPDSRHLTVRFTPEQDRFSDRKLRSRAMIADDVRFERIEQKSPKKAERETTEVDGSRL